MRKKTVKTDSEAQIESLRSRLKTIELDFQEKLNNQREELITRIDNHVDFFQKFRQSYRNLGESFIKAAEGIADTLTYTQAEIAKMGSEEYRSKILIPLGLGKKV